jgi:hypothetical protein
VKLVPAGELEHFFLRRQRGLARPRDARQLIVAQRAHVGGYLLAGNALLRVVACAMAAFKYSSANQKNEKLQILTIETSKDVKNARVNTFKSAKNFAPILLAMRSVASCAKSRPITPK